MCRILKNASTEASEKASQDIIRETMTIMIEGKPVTVYKDEIEKILYSHLNPVLDGKISTI